MYNQRHSSFKQNYGPGIERIFFFVCTQSDARLVFTRGIRARVNVLL